MTASLPVPHDAYSGEPDDVVVSARTESGRVVELPPKPRISAEEAASAAEPIDASPTGPKRPARAPRQAPRAPRSKPKPRARPAAAPVVDPGPPPPLPDLAATIIVPPRPPLPPLHPVEVPEPFEAVDALPETTDDAPPTDAEETEAADGAASEADPALHSERVTVPEPEPEPVTKSVPEPEPVAESVPEPEPVPVPELAAAPQPEPEPTQAAEPPPTAVASVTIEHAPDVEIAQSEHPSTVQQDPLRPFVDAAALGVVFADDELADTAADAETPALAVRGVTKSFGETRAVDGIDLTVPAGTFYGLVGPNGAGKTTTLSMIAGLLRPTRGSVMVNGIDATRNPVAAKRMMGVLPDRLRTFDRLTGRQLLYYYGVLRGLPPAVVETRTADLARAFDLTDALGRVVSDYSAGMTKKVMLAGAMIHSPRLLVLDEPFEAVDPVSSAIILDILGAYVAHGGTVILSSHGMELVERVCSRVAVIVAGQVLAEGTIDEVRGELTLEQRFIELAGGLSDVEGLEWLHTFSD